MRIFATKEELEGAPSWLTEFLTRAWAEPDENGQRAALARFDDMKRIAGTLALQVDEAAQNPDLVDRHFTFTVTPEGGQFGQAAFWNDRTAELAEALAIAWNSRATLTSCQTCEKLLQPSKGKAARFCSTACRVASHRGAA